MFSVVSEIDIEASPAVVWAALSQFADYPRWHPFVRIQGELEPDGDVSYSLLTKLGGTGRVTMGVRLSALEPGRRLAFHFGWRWLLWFQEAYIVTPTVAGTRVTHSFQFGGALGLISLPVVKRNLVRTLDIENRSLRRFASAGKQLPSQRPAFRRGFRPGR